MILLWIHCTNNGRIEVRKVILIQCKYRFLYVFFYTQKVLHHFPDSVTKQTRNCVYETLCPQPLACLSSCSPGTLITILLQLTKSEATGCNDFHDIFIGNFRYPNLQRALTQTNAKTITKKEIFLSFHQVSHSLPPISCPTLELLVVTVSEISSFLLKKSQRAITQKI